jgi:hypothetical protein
MLRTALFSLLALGVCSTSAFAQELRGDELKRLIEMPLKNIYVEYPNKTGHTFVDSTDLRLSPRDLHPAFYGCFDWHSAVHSHWMLCEVLRTNPQLAEREAILEAFDKHFTESNMLAEATYFDRKLAGSYERTYGWAWLLKLSEELHRLASEENDAELQGKAKVWSRHVDLLADKIVQKWKLYLPKVNYPNRIGTHSNSAFALAFAIDYARSRGDQDFEQALLQKARELHASDRHVPAEWEPNATDFFSPSLMVADLMTRVLPQREYVRWLSSYFTPAGIDRLCQRPQVSDLTDYTIVHLVGLAFTRAWTMARIAQYLPKGHALKVRFTRASRELYRHGMSQIFNSNYGGDHWLATFARYADEVMRSNQ